MKDRQILLSEGDESAGSPASKITYYEDSGGNNILQIKTSTVSSKELMLKIIGPLKDVFLPDGYPDSVSDDYVEYQIWDTVQACASTITGTLITKVILQSVGVGNSEANAASAAITWILKDGTGMIARIVFAWAVGTELDSNCKKWRLFADIINDIAMCIELTVLPIYPDLSLFILCFSTSLKALVGVAGGATRAAITQHQAIKQNMADVSAKDGSQETCVNLVASFIGLGILSVVTDATTLWYVFIVMTVLHLYANYKAVKCLNFTFFNEGRLNLAITNFLDTKVVLSPYEVNQYESVFLLGGVSCKQICGYRVIMGHSIGSLLSEKIVNIPQLQFLKNLYKHRQYTIFVHDKLQQIHVGLAKGCKSSDLVEAYFHAVFTGIARAQPGRVHLTIPEEYRICPESATNKKENPEFLLMMKIDQMATVHYSNFLMDARKWGWDIDRTLLPVGKWRLEFGNEYEDIEENNALKYERKRK